MVPGSLSGRVAIVTGAASGIGRGTALTLARRGASVVLGDLDESGCAAAADEITSAGGQATGARCDVTDESSIAGLVAAAMAKYGSVDIVHANAALTDPVHQARDLGPVEIELEVWNRTLAVNLTGQLLLCKHAIPRLLDRRRGSIVLMSSVSAVRGDVNGVAYAASKAGVLALARSVATKYGRRGIRCSSVSPGIVLTPSVAANLSEEIRQEYVDNLLVPEAGTELDVANVVAFLASDESQYVNGQDIVVDGGFSAHSPAYAGIRRALRSTT